MIADPIAVDSKKLEHGAGAIYAGFPSSLGFGVGGQSYSHFLASTVSQEPKPPTPIEEMKGEMGSVKRSPSRRGLFHVLSRKLRQGLQFWLIQGGSFLSQFRYC